MKTTDNGTPMQKERGTRIFTVVVLALLCAMILAAIIVPIGIYRSQGEKTVSYGAITVRTDLYVFWLSAYKYAYLSAAMRQDPTVTDSPEFWNSAPDGKTTRAAEARAGAEGWIKRIVFAASLFEEEDLSLSKSTLNDLQTVCDHLLQYELNTEKAYDRAAKEIGFNYSTVRRALFYQTEGEAYVGPLNDADYETFCTIAESAVTILPAAAKIDFITLPTDARLYSTPYLP